MQDSRERGVELSLPATMRRSIEGQCSLLADGLDGRVEPERQPPPLHASADDGGPVYVAIASQDGEEQHWPSSSQPECTGYAKELNRWGRRSTALL